MALKPFSKDYLLSSTPLQATDDSGYFGSGQRRNNAVVLNSCSPIKESSHTTLLENVRFMSDLSPRIKFGQNLNFENLRKSELSSIDFSNPDFNSQFELYKSPQPSYEVDKETYDDQVESYSIGSSTSQSLSSLSVDNDIRYKLFDYMSSDKSSLNNLKYKFESKNVIIFGSRKVDFIHELVEKNCYPIVSYILSLLSTKELCIASCVSKEWNKAILADSKANVRRQKLITERLTFLNGPSKENRKGMKYGSAKEHKNVLSELTNINMSLNTSGVKVSNSKFDSFIRESRNSKSQLIKCPRCFHASRKQNENQYMCSHCSYHFCSVCLDPYFTSHTCFKPLVPNIIVGSKKSKRNLKRL